MNWIKSSSIIILLISFLLLILSAYVSFALGIYVDETGTSPDQVLGNIGNLAQWFTVLFSVVLFVICIINVIKVFKK